VTKNYTKHGYLPPQDMRAVLFILGRVWFILSSYYLLKTLECVSKIDEMVIGQIRRGGCLVESKHMSDVSCWAPSQPQLMTKKARHCIFDFVLEIVKAYA
jgi:hypothetical protein